MDSLRPATFEIVPSGLPEPDLRDLGVRLKKAANWTSLGDSMCGASSSQLQKTTYVRDFGHSP